LVEMGRIAIDVHRDVINLNGLVTPPCLGVTRGDHVSWSAMETMIPTMLMINMSTDAPHLPLQLWINQGSSRPSNSVYGRW
jgi:hypothetical protein